MTWYLNRRRPIPSTVANNTEQIVGADGAQMQVQIFQPLKKHSSPPPVLLWVHGGGLISGTHHDDDVCGHLAHTLGIPVVSPAYRLAPEHPYPAAHQDLLATIEWIRNQENYGRFDKSRLLISGGSSGGGLAASLAQRLHDDGIPVAGQVLVYPMLDDRTAVRDRTGQRDHLLWNNRSNHFGWSSYLGAVPGSEGVDGYAAPARRTDLTGLPPTWIGIGTVDLFYEESIDYANRLKAAGVDCELLVLPGAPHGFDRLRPNTKLARTFTDSQTSFIHDLISAPQARQ